jgi:hypothetical protein
LKTLVKSCGFDENCLRFDGYIRFEELPKDFQYQYWGERLLKLHEVVKNPKPKGVVKRWLQRHASERNALYVALISLVFTALLGLLSLILAVFQSWLAWQAWKQCSQQSG